jgi:hypothetical protein
MLSHMGQQSTHFLLNKIFTNMTTNHNKGFLKILCFIFAKGIGLFPHVKTSNYTTWLVLH